MLFVTVKIGLSTKFLPRLKIETFVKLWHFLQTDKLTIPTSFVISLTWVRLVRLNLIVRSGVHSDVKTNLTVSIQGE